jgi:hypothetical protein
LGLGAVKKGAFQIVAQMCCRHYPFVETCNK